MGPESNFLTLFFKPCLFKFVEVVTDIVKDISTFPLCFLHDFGSKPTENYYLRSQIQSFFEEAIVCMTLSAFPFAFQKAKHTLILKLVTTLENYDWN